MPVVRPLPPRSARCELLLSLMTIRPDDRVLLQQLRRRYVAERARDFGILQEVSGEL